MSRCVLLVSADKEGDEVVLRHLVLCTGFLHRLSESNVTLVVGEVLHYVGNTHFEDNVHTALEVKTQTDLCLKALLVGVEPKELNRVLVILLCNWILNLRSLAVIILCGSREREIEDACKCQQDGCYNYNTFVLHFFDFIFVIIVFSVYVFRFVFSPSFDVFVL